MHPFWSPSTPLCTGILHGVLEWEPWSLGGVWTRGHYKGKSLWCRTCPLHRRGTFLSLFSLMLGLGVKYLANIRIHVKCQGAAYLHSGRAAALAIVLSGTSPPPCRPGVLLVCFKIHPFLICDPGDWTCNSRRVTSLAACPQVGLYNVFPIICSMFMVYCFNWIQLFCRMNKEQFFFFLKYWHLLLAHRGEEKAREALVWLRGTTQVWSNILNPRICSLFFLLWANALTIQVDGELADLLSTREKQARGLTLRFHTLSQDQNHHLDFAWPILSIPNPPGRPLETFADLIFTAHFCWSLLISCR